jgi:ribonuclease HI
MAINPVASLEKMDPLLPENPSDHILGWLRCYPVSDEPTAFRMHPSGCDANFVVEVEAELGARPLRGSPFGKYQRLKEVLRAVYTRQEKARRLHTDHPLQQIAHLTTIIRLLNRPSVNRAEIHRVGDACPTLKMITRIPDLANVLSSATTLLNKLLQAYEEENEDETDPVKIYDSLIKGNSDNTNQYAKSLRAGKFILPSRRRAFLHFEVDDCIVDDPDEMTKTAAEHLSNIWGQQPTDARKMKEVLTNYTRRLRKSPKQPTLDLFLNILKENKSSAPGPDGIPFQAWRAVADIAAPVFLAVARSLQERDPYIPDWFNQAVLYFFPKVPNATSPGQGRPISVTNTGNRVIAAAFKAVLDDATSAWILPHQKGFVPGRTIDANLQYVTRRYYTDHADGNEGYLLAADFSKAFDSVSHEFIVKVLETINMPRWVINVVSNLLRQATVFLSLKGARAQAIELKRGVKQGCPLSPLLFNLCMDVLIFHMAHVPSVDPRAFADDFSVYFNHPSSFREIASVLQDFCLASGLRINVKKTKILPTLNDTRAIWPGIETADEIKYLGLYVGKGIDPVTNWHAPLEKFRNRVKALYRVRFKLSKAKKILYLNRLCYPLFYYVGRFCLMPQSVRQEINALSRSLLTGTYMELDDTKRTTEYLGLRNALDDPAFRCYSYMAAHHKRVPPDVGVLNATYSVDAQRACAYHLAAGYTDMTTDMKSADIYSKIVRSDYIKTRTMQRIEKVFTSGTAPRYRGGRAMDNDDVDHALANYRRLPKTLPDYVRIRYVELIHNAFPTSRRQNYAHKQGKSHLVHSEPNAKCHLCSLALDDIEHLIGSCTVVESAFDAIKAEYGITRVSYNRKSFYLAFDGTSTATRALLFLIILLHCIILVRKLSMDTPDPVTTEFISRRFRTETGKLNKALHPLVNPDVIQGTDSFDLAVKARRSRVPAALGLAIQNLIHHYEDGYHVIIYTDGSANPNPGPSGAGVVFANFPEPGDIQTFAVPCGQGSNNIGELHAIGYALNILAKDLPSQKKIAIFSDSNYAMDIAKGISAYHSHPNLARSVRDLFTAISACKDIRMHWLPGHANLAGNEAADLLAKEAVTKNTNDTMPIDDTPYPVYDSLDPASYD